MLLTRNGVNPNTVDTVYGETPLSLAAKNGNEGIVKILLERSDVDPGTVNEYGQTPLSWALENGHEQIAKLLR